MDVSRRDLLALGGLTVAGATLAPSLARAQTPKRGGTISVCAPGIRRTSIRSRRSPTRPTSR